MVKRVYSLETEYALAHDTLAASPVARATEELYELLEAELLAKQPHAACDPTGRQSQATGTSLVEICEGFFLANGARLYFDAGHLEWAAPEAGDPYQAVVYDRAGELELAAAASAVERQLGDGRPLIVKNNLDYQSGVTYGCHENYSVRRRSDAGRDVMRQVIRRLVPFLITRQILCGAGRLGADRAPHVAFQLSQRADFLTSVSSVETRENRPIVNLRDEPLADGQGHARLHLILGDSNMAEYPAFLKLGMTGILLDMIEADAALPNLVLHRPQDALYKVSRDLEFSCRLPLRGGGSETALGVQRAYWQAARDFVAHRREEDPLAQRVVQMWGGLLTAIERSAPELEFYLDWAIKRSLLGEVLEQESLTWEELEAWEPVLARTWEVPLPQSRPPGDWGAWWRKHLPEKWMAIEMWSQEHGLDWTSYPRFRQIAAKLRALDIRYHDIDPKRGLFHRWGQAARVTSDDAEFEIARREAPKNTRAAVRTRAIYLADEHGEEIRMDWDRIHLTSLKGDISLPDPFSNDVSILNQAFPPISVARGPKVRLPRPPKAAPKRAAVKDDGIIEIVVLDVEELSDADDQ